MSSNIPLTDEDALMLSVSADAVLVKAINQAKNNAEIRNESERIWWTHSYESWKQHDDWSKGNHLENDRPFPPIPKAWGLLFENGDQTKPYTGRTDKPLLTKPVDPVTVNTLANAPIIVDMMPEAHPESPTTFAVGPMDTAPNGYVDKPFGQMGPWYRKTIVMSPFSPKGMASYRLIKQDGVMPPQGS